MYGAAHTEDFFHCNFNNLPLERIVYWEEDSLLGRG